MNTNYNPPPLPILLADVCNALEIPISDMVSRSRKRTITWPRHIFCYVAFFYTDHSLKEIGQLVGGRDHTTAIHSRDTATDYLNKKDSDFLTKWELFKEKSVYWNELQLIRVSRSIHM